MKVLWTTNTIPPPLAGRLGYKVAGHWMWGLLELVRPWLEQITIVTEQEGVPSIELTEGNLRMVVIGVEKPLIKWIPARRCSDAVLACVRQSECDLIHVHGTEHPYARTCRLARPDTPIALSIQGLVGPYARYMQGTLGTWDALWVNGLVAAIRGTSPVGQKYAFGRSAVDERANVAVADIALCRTTWDRGHVLALRPELKVAHASEVIRAEFMSADWRVRSRHNKDVRLLFTNGSTLVKNVAEILPAMAVLVRRGYTPHLTLAGFGSVRNYYVSRLQAEAHQAGLEGRVTFLGYLSAEAMVKEMLAADIYVSASLIDNSPNSICEAQLVGIPVVTSAVGGALDLVQHNRTGLLYQVGEYQQLAECITRLVDDRVLSERLSAAARQVARKRHAPEMIRRQYLDVYARLVAFSRKAGRTP